MLRFIAGRLRVSCAKALRCDSPATIYKIGRKVRLRQPAIEMEQDTYDMEESENIRQRLIIAGIKEIELHGLHDFSLRRVSKACGLSCAAPYRHFSSRDALLLEIVRYINRQWELLRTQIEEAYRGDVKRQLLEVCMANIRFRIGNPNFHTVLMLDEAEMDPALRREKSGITEGCRALIRQFCARYDVPPEEEKRRTCAIRALIYGASVMLAGGELENTPETMQMLRSCLEEQLSCGGH